MKEIELIQLIAANISNNTMDNMFQHFASDCTYYSDGSKMATGKNDVCAFFTKRKSALNRDHVQCFAYPATIEESEERDVVVGANCVALCQFDKYNCVGFMTIQTNLFGNIKQFAFHTTSKVTFKTSAPGKFNVTKVPEDAHDAIGYRAFAFGIMDEHVVLSKHIRRYDIFHDYVQRVYTFIVQKLNADFNQGISNAAGYLYISAMATAVQSNNGTTLFQFDETVSTSGKIPVVDARYQAWINEGYETGKKLFFGFIEYVNLRSPKGDYFDGQLRQSFLDMTLYGSTQANKDMDMGIPVSDKPEISELRIAVQNLLSSQSPDNMRGFAKVLKSYIDDGTWIHMPCKKYEKGFRMRIVDSRGKHFAALYSDASEIRNKGKDDIVLTDINKLIEPVFQNTDIDGIVIDPDTTSLCLEKHFLLKCILHGSYPEVDNGSSPQKDWGAGIPKYTKDDLMTAGEIQNFAMHTVIDYDQALQQRYRLISGCDYPGAMPSLIFGNDKTYLFIYIKGYTTMEEPTLSDAERSELLSMCEKYNAKGYWAPVGFLSTDPARFEANLALKGDGFYCKYQGLREV
ncbi:MAG: hypothetical protein IJL46_01810 [Clostridia bacterium]|nr:hypothetical protein [Clostridia bacterium]MBQ5956286.1 hypothetical protein [Clostridia bacterium]MBQ6003304.1 hypothetical protein [Clostridia bacterium]